MEPLLPSYEAFESGASKALPAPRSCRLPPWRSVALTLAGALILVQGALLWRAQSASASSLALLQSLERAQAEHSDASGGVGVTAERNKPMTASNRQLAAARPHKFLISGVTPSVDQMARGDCWLFAMTGVLEDSYRRYGVERGWLEPNTYVELSRQALGIAVMEFCREHPSSMCPADSDGDGEIWWGNTTEGADERMLYFFKALGAGALPASVCPYSPTPADQKLCRGLDERRATNPLSFNVTRADMFYESIDIKDALLERQHALTLGLAMAWNEVYLPCTAATSSLYPGCAALGRTGECPPCPRTREFEHVGCCAAERRPMVTMRGEWYYTPHGTKIELGGHAINIVGYTDTYVDEHGNVGGFVVRNSWSDGLGVAHASKGRGSHSYLYYMRAVSDWDEARVCPNPHSPRSWAHCDSLRKCTHDGVAIDGARAQRKPMLLECIDNGGYLLPGLCERGQGYYMKNLTEWDSGADRAGLFVACFLRADSGAELCAPPLLLDDLATVFTPEGIDEGKHPLNQQELCGFNFIPYTLIDETQSRFGFLVSSSFEIEWARSSYPSQRGAAAAEREGAPRLDYTLLEQSLKPMPVVEKKAGPLWV